MPGQRLLMRQIREVLRLKHVCGHSGHQIAAMVGVSRYTVAEYLRRAAVVGITWPVPAALDDVALERRLFTPPFTPEPGRPQPEWARIHAELRRPGVTLLLLWEGSVEDTSARRARLGAIERPMDEAPAGGVCTTAWPSHLIGSKTAILILLRKSSFKRYKTHSMQTGTCVLHYIVDYRHLTATEFCDMFAACSSSWPFSAL